MRSLLLVVALTACVAEDGPTEGSTLGSGTLTNAAWSVGLCQAGFVCSGELRIGGWGFIARIGDTDEIARGDLTQATRDQLDALVAAIPLSEPTGVFTPDGGDGGRVEYDVERSGEARIYYTNGFRGDLG